MMHKYLPLYRMKNWTILFLYSAFCFNSEVNGWVNFCCRNIEVVDEPWCDDCDDGQFVGEFCWFCVCWFFVCWFCIRWFFASCCCIFDEEIECSSEEFVPLLCLFDTNKWLKDKLKEINLLFIIKLKNKFIIIL